MFERVELRATDLAGSRRFYGTVLGALPILPSGRDGDGRAIAWGDFALVQADAAHPATSGLHLGFAASSRDAVDAFWEAGLRAGHADAGQPGLRPQYVADYYGAFLTDPDGNSAEAVHYADMRAEGAVDHLWIGVANLDAAQRWYDELAARAGLAVGEHEQRFHVREGGPRGGSFALVADGRAPTRNARLAIRSGSAAAVGAHRDPDGNRVEVVHVAR
jgi:catechol 2,3-dioxygenase-like lactoylglutathione lyase family enzyme